LVVDKRCCKEAWQHGIRLVRIHHSCFNMQHVITTAIELQAASFVMSTSHYSNVTVINKGQQQSYIDWVGGQLSTATKHTHKKLGCVMYL
jgi:hypothetical protein